MLVYGRNVAKDYLEKFCNDIKRIIIQDNLNDKYLISLLENVNCSIKRVPIRQMDELANGNHQGIILDVTDYKYYDVDVALSSELIVVLDHLEDPHNFGAIIRTCEAAGVDCIVIPSDRSVQVNATVMKTSAGALTRMKVVMVANISNFLSSIKKNGFWVVGTAMDGTDYREIDYNGKVAIVIGNEGKGMSRVVTNECDFIASIPMSGEINSLNASVATGIMVYEAIRNRK
ncbi:MAG: 23S rRNA (guanosine(2251)-2'-O)-methyltransferase RlmB [Bacilli bacterium]|nr:23S rRNA (guanosine(2251)-2'-O)-methyltransferase RlmB [Bacilli bacterium]